MNKKLLIRSLALGSIAVISLADFSEKTTHLCTLSGSFLQEKITADCSKIYTKQEDSIRDIYEGKFATYELSCFRIKNEEDEREARAVIEKQYFPPIGYDINAYLLHEKVFCQVGIHRR